MNGPIGSPLDTPADPDILSIVSSPLDVTVRIRPTDLTWREVQGEVIALDLVSATYFTTNKTGTLLWRALVDGATVGGLVALLRSAYGLSEETAAADVGDFLRLLGANGLLDSRD